MIDGILNHNDRICRFYGGVTNVHLCISRWRHQMEAFSALQSLCVQNSPVTDDAEFWCFLWSAWINGWVNNHEAGDLRRHRAHYDVTVMIFHACQHHPPHGALLLWCDNPPITQKPIGHWPFDIKLWILAVLCIFFLENELNVIK